MQIEVATINPAISMQQVGNAALKTIASLASLSALSLRFNDADSTVQRAAIIDYTMPTA